MKLRQGAVTQDEYIRNSNNSFGFDETILDQKLNELREPRFRLHNPIFKQLLRMPADQVVDRTTSAFSSLNLIAALMLTGITVIALAPLDVDAVADNKRDLANAFNIIAVVLMNVSVLNVMCTTYILMSLSAERPSTIYCFLTKAEGPTLVFFLATWISGVLYLALGVLGLWIRSDEWAAIAITIFSGCFLLVSQLHYSKMESVLFPLGHSGWGALALGLFWSERVRQRAKATGEVCAAEALGHLSQHDGGAQADFLPGEACAKFAGLLPGLVDVLSRALPGESEGRLRELGEQMAREGLSAETLRRTAVHDARLLFMVPRHIATSTRSRAFLARRGFPGIPKD